jgi:alkaline phosphatase D
MKHYELARRSAIAALVFAIVSGSAFAQDWRWKEGRQNIVQIVDGKLDEAIADLDKRLAASPKHGEVLFTLAAAWARSGDVDKGLDFVSRALDAGVPFERFLAGPRDLLAPLISSEGFQHLAKARAAQLLHGPLLGDVTDSSARFWARTRDEVAVEAHVWCTADREDAVTIASPSMRTRADRDYTVVVEVPGLRPDTEYAYRLVVDGVEEKTAHRFRTFPVQGQAAKFDIVFGGGAAYTPSYERVFTTIAKRRPLAFLQLGDNVYIDQPKKPAAQRYCYYRRQSSAPYRALTASTAIFSIWDDHDFGDDDCWGGPDIDKPKWKRPVWKIFQQNWNNPDYAGGDEHPGCYYDTRIGDVHLIFLDCRYYRTKPKGTEPGARSMLGSVQKRWLLETLKSSTGTFKVLASSVPFALGVKPRSKDPWDGYPEEREELFGFIAKERIEGVVLIAADRHRSDLWKIERPGAYDLYEFQSSRLTNIHTHQVMKASIWGFNKDRSFGLLSFDTTKDDPEVTYRVVTIGDEVVRSFTLKRSALAMP